MENKLVYCLRTLAMTMVNSRRKQLPQRCQNKAFLYLFDGGENAISVRMAMILIENVGSKERFHFEIIFVELNAPLGTVHKILRGRLLFIYSKNRLEWGNLCDLYSVYSISLEWMQQFRRYFLYCNNNSYLFFIAFLRNITEIVL